MLGGGAKRVRSGRAHRRSGGRDARTARPRSDAEYQDDDRSNRPPCGAARGGAGLGGLFRRLRFLAGPRRDDGAGRLRQGPGQPGRASRAVLRSPRRSGRAGHRAGPLRPRPRSRSGQPGPADEGGDDPADHEPPAGRRGNLRRAAGAPPRPPRGALQPRQDLHGKRRHGPGLDPSQPGHGHRSGRPARLQRPRHPARPGGRARGRAGALPPGPGARPEEHLGAQQPRPLPGAERQAGRGHRRAGRAGGRSRRRPDGAAQPRGGLRRPGGNADGVRTGSRSGP
jgi:hypothetical protein